MSSTRRFSLSAAIRRALQSTSSSETATDTLHVIEEATITRILDLAMRIGDSMMAVGSSAHEVTLALTRVARAYDLNTVHVNVTYDSVIVSYHRGDGDQPITLMRVIKAASPDYSKLQRLQALLFEIEDGLELEEARHAFRHIKRTPFRYRPVVVLCSRALLATGISVMFGGSPVIMALTFIAALAASLTQAWLLRLRVPRFFSQVAGGFAVTAVAVTVSALGAAGIDPFVGVRPSIIVASGIMLMLAGLAVVGAAQDAIDGFALTAIGRILDLTIQTLGVVLGILLGLEVGRVLGILMVLPTGSQEYGPLTALVLGALLASVAVGLSNGAGLRTLVVTGVLSAVAIVSFFGARELGLNPVASSGIGAFLASVVGAFMAYRFHVPSVAVITAAIIPLVPGGTVFQGLLGVVEAGGTADGLVAGGGSLVTAGMIGIALATGASFGLFLGTPVWATLRSVVRSRAGLRR